MTIEVVNETQYKFDELEFIQLAVFTLKKMYVSPDSDLDIKFVNSEFIAKLHNEYLEIPGPTDVMSFPMDELKPGSAQKPAAAGILGDIVICPEVAAKQANKVGHSYIDEMLLLEIHSILHLLGFDHVEKTQKKIMFDLQRTILMEFLAAK
ncbi:MAG: rRNA maturation RNase YbeY [Bifidobacteriaceae bacterium]|jgi:probable rRNA maturation factor|nr:rRNA maturation RNase YbeY [Bifidobacteriaceae bacterium]